MLLSQPISVTTLYTSSVLYSSALSLPTTPLVTPLLPPGHDLCHLRVQAWLAVRRSHQAGRWRATASGTRGPALPRPPGRQWCAVGLLALVRPTIAQVVSSSPVIVVAATAAAAPTVATYVFFCCTVFFPTTLPSSRTFYIRIAILGILL